MGAERKTFFTVKQTLNAPQCAVQAKTYAAMQPRHSQVLDVTDSTRLEPAPRDSAANAEPGLKIEN